MAFPTISVLGRSSNKALFRLTNKGIPVHITSTTDVVIELDTKQEIKFSETPFVFDWLSGPPGVLKLSLGKLWWPTRIYYAKLITIDDFYPEGLFWGMFRIRAMENANAS